MSYQLELEVLEIKKTVKFLMVRMEKLEAENKILKNKLSEINNWSEMKFGKRF